MKNWLIIANITFLISASAYFIFKHSFYLQTVTESGKGSYSLGQDVAKNFLRQGISIEKDAFYQGFIDGLSEKNKINVEQQKMAEAWAQNQAKLLYEEHNKLRQEKLQKTLEAKATHLKKTPRNLEREKYLMALKNKGAQENLKDISRSIGQKKSGRTSEEEK